MCRKLFNGIFKEKKQTTKKCNGCNLNDELKIIKQQVIDNKEIYALEYIADSFIN